MEQIEFEGVVYKFELLTIGQEDEYKHWVRDSIINEAMESSDGWPMDLRAKFLADVSKSTPLDKCSITGDIGKERLATDSAIIKVLEMASRKNHPPPGIPEATLKKMAEAKQMETGRTICMVLPISDEIRKKGLEELAIAEKKAIGLRDGQA